MLTAEDNGNGDDKRGTKSSSTSSNNSGDDTGKNEKKKDNKKKSKLPKRGEYKPESLEKMQADLDYIADGENGNPF